MAATAPTQTLTDRDFTGQKENRELGLLYYNARFYVPSIGRFLSADTLVPNPANPQSFNRYSYVLNSPVNYSDSTGHCAETKTAVGDDEFFIRSIEDKMCWFYFDSIINLMEHNSGYADAIDWNHDGEAAQYEQMEVDELRARWQHHLKRSSEPQSCWGSGGSAACNRAKFSEAFHLDELPPDALIFPGASGSAAGIWYGVVGEEVLANRHTGEISTFEYYGQGAGVALGADASIYTGLVWNLERNIDYNGPFTTLTVDLALIEGGQFNFFWDSNTIPFTGSTWGVAVGKSTGAGGGVTISQTYFTCQVGCTAR